MSFPQKVVRAAYGAVSKLLELQLRGVGAEADDDAAAPTDRAALLQPMGMAVLPIVARTLRADVEQDGGEPYVKRLWDKARTPTDLESGETRLYAVGAIATAIKLLTSRIDVVAAEIRLGAGATKGVARLGDDVQVTIPTGTQFTMTVPGVGTVTATTTVDVECNGEVTSASATVKAKD